MRTAVACVVVIVVSVHGFGATADVERVGPSGLDVGQVLVSEFGATAGDIEQLRQGQPFVTVRPSTLDHEVVVVGAVRINAPAERTIEALRDVGHLERGGGVLQTIRLSEPPELQDFAGYTITPEDLASLQQCRPGQCAVKLGRDALERLGAIAWASPDVGEQVNRLARRSALEYVHAYRRGGNAAMAVYADRARPLCVAREFTEMVQRLGVLQRPLAPLTAILLEYPRRSAPPGNDFFYWSLADFGLKPVFRVNHVVIQPLTDAGPARFAVATKQLYANHYFRAALEVRVLADAAPDGAAHDLLVVNMARSDGLTGLLEGVVRAKVRAAARQGLLRALAGTKQFVEGASASVGRVK
jgi:hypothetical protein